jgi:hypothetical protein
MTLEARLSRTNLTHYLRGTTRAAWPKIDPIADGNSEEKYHKARHIHRSIQLSGEMGASKNGDASLAKRFTGLISRRPLAMATSCFAVPLLFTSEFSEEQTLGADSQLKLSSQILHTT